MDRSAAYDRSGRRFGERTTTLSKGMTSAGRALARLAMALVLVLFALAPAFDAVACAGDEEAHAVAAAHGSRVTATPAVVHDHDGGAADLHGLCAHGHCHHAATAWPLREPVQTPSLIRATGERPALTRLPPSRDPAGLDRPPRA
jgi:hypothetical protein